MRLLLFLLFCLVNSLIIGQVEGRIVDAGSQKPISYVYVTILSQGLGTLSNEEGEFQIEANLKKSDSLTISCIGYETLIVPLSEEYYDLELFAKDIEIPAIDFTASLPTDTLMGCIESHLDHERINGFVQSFGYSRRVDLSNLGSELAIRINLDSLITYAKLASVGFYIPDAGYPKTPFRLIIYSVDSLTQSPGDPILGKSFILKSNITDGWYDINLEGEDIFLAKYGAFISMEWLVKNKKKFWTKRNFKKHDNISEELKAWSKAPLFGQVLGMYGDVQTEIWQRHHFSDWWMNEIPRQPMIRATVSQAR